MKVEINIVNINPQENMKCKLNNNMSGFLILLQIFICLSSKCYKANKLFFPNLLPVYNCIFYIMCVKSYRQDAFVKSDALADNDVMTQALVFFLLGK